MSNRILKGEGEFKRQNSAYIIPADDMPDGLVNGQKYKMIIEGTLTIDEQRGVIEADKIYAEEATSRDDPLQKQIEDGLNIEVSVEK